MSVVLDAVSEDYYVSIEEMVKGEINKDRMEMEVEVFEQRLEAQSSVQLQFKMQNKEQAVYKPVDDELGVIHNAPEFALTNSNSSMKTAQEDGVSSADNISLASECFEMKKLASKDLEWLEWALTKFFCDITVVPCDPKFKDAYDVFQYLLDAVLLVQNDGKNGVPVIPGIGWVQKKRLDQFAKRAHSRIQGRLYNEIRNKYGEAQKKSFLEAKLIAEYSTGKAGDKHLVSLLGSGRKNDLSEDDQKYLLENKKLFDRICDLKMAQKVVKVLEGQTKGDIDLLIGHIRPYFDSSNEADYLNMDHLKNRIQKSKEFKKPCTYLENLLSVKRFFERLLKKARKCKPSKDVSASLKQLTEDLQRQIKERSWHLERKVGKGHKLIDYESFVFVSKN